MNTDKSCDMAAAQGLHGSHMRSSGRIRNFRFFSSIVLRACSAGSVEKQDDTPSGIGKHGQIQAVRRDVVGIAAG
jgi:hypothetical protein